jgi:predicted N-acetyltransferase YhbS
MIGVEVYTLESQGPFSQIGGSEIIFGNARFPEEYDEILSLRLKAHQNLGHCTGLTRCDLASPFDHHSRHLVCRAGGRIVGYVRITQVDSDLSKSQYVSLGRHQVPDWLWRAGFVEGGAGAVEAEYRGRGLYLILMKNAVRITRALGYRYLLGACEDGLVPMYSRMGFKWLETRDVEPKPNWKFRSNLILLDIDPSPSRTREGSSASPDKHFSTNFQSIG